MATKEEMLKFAKEIDSLVAETGFNYIDAIVEHCTRTGLEIEMAATLINSNLKAKIEYDAQELNMLPKTGKLPI
jgi:hypothetical protein